MYSFPASVTGRAIRGFDYLYPMKNLPIGIQSLIELRAFNGIYVDETQLVHQLVTTGRLLFFYPPASVLQVVAGLHPEGTLQRQPRPVRWVVDRTKLGLEPDQPRDSYFV